MEIRTSRFKVYLLKSTIDLLEKINTKPCFILYNEEVKADYILDAHNNGKKYFDTVNAKKFLNWTKIPKIWRNMSNI